MVIGIDVCHRKSCINRNDDNYCIGSEVTVRHCGARCSFSPTAAGKLLEHLRKKKEGGDGSEIKQ